jgi:hypothetical protein
MIVLGDVHGGLIGILRVAIRPETRLTKKLKGKLDRFPRKSGSPREAAVVALRMKLDDYADI